MINTIAGNGTAAFSGDGAPANLAEVNTPYGVAADAAGNVYIADYGNNRIRKIDASGIISTIAGTGTPGFFGDGGAATAAQLYGPRGIAVDAAGNVFFSDYANNRIRKISTSGVITTVAGNGMPGFGGDTGPATNAKLNFAWGVAVDVTGNLYIADQLNCRIRKVNTSGTISTIGGTGIAFFYGDGGQATSAGIQYPLGVAVDAAGNVYVADNGDNRIRVINPSGIITTIAGSATYGFSGDGGPSTLAKLYYPQGIAVDGTGNVYICDLNNNRIRMINTSGIINSIVGDGTAAFSGDGGPAVLAEINQSTGVAIDPAGNIYIADNNNNRIRVIRVVSHAPYFTKGHHIDVSYCFQEGIGIDSLLKVFDIDTGQTETWSIVTPAVHGALTIGYSTLSTGSILTPSGLLYTAAGAYTGVDSFRIRVTDGLYSDTTTIYLTILPQPDAGVITGPDSVCIGDSIQLADVAPGGTWGSDNTGISTVSTTGKVTGIAAGTNFITYTVTNICGTQTAPFPMLVTVDCHTAVNTLPRSDRQMHVFPNPGSGSLTIELKLTEKEKIHFVINNSLGVPVKEFDAESDKNIDLQMNMPSGVYYISATCGSEHWNEKIIIAR